MSIAGLPTDVRERCRELAISSKAILLEIARQFDEAAMFDYLTKYPDIRKQKELSKKNPRNGLTAAKRETGTGGASRALGDSGFVYRPDGAGFTVSVTFDKPLLHNKNAVLSALKQAFDDVKNEKIVV